MHSKNLTQLIYTILKKNKDERDDMMLVVKRIHDIELNSMDKTKHDYYEVFFSKSLSSIKTIDRIWRKVQEEDASIRGEKWIERQVQAGVISMKIANESKNQLSLFTDI